MNYQERYDLTIEYVPLLSLLTRNKNKKKNEDKTIDMKFRYEPIKRKKRSSTCVYVKYLCK